MLDIERVTAADLGTYKVEVFNLVRSVGNEAIIELRHEGEKKKSSHPIIFIDTVNTLSICTPKFFKDHPSSKNFLD